MKRVYAHYHRPEDYPDYLKRPIRVTTRKTLKNEIQFMSLRALPHTPDGTLLDIDDTLDLYTKRFHLGNVFWMRANTVTAPNLSEFLDAVVERDGYVFDLWGFVPGSYKEGVDWGEYTVSDETHKLFLDKLGDRFIGYDNGEQDGRYIGSYARTQCPARQSDLYQQRRFYEFFDAMGRQLQHSTTALCSLNYCHFFARENNCYMLGAETAQALPNANLWYAYLRGAGKQYGLLWFGNASVYNRFSWKTYEFEDAHSEGYIYGPTVGTSLSLLRRLLYVEYLYNSDMLGFESGLLTLRENMEALAAGKPLKPMDGTDDKKTETTLEQSVLSPIGQLQSDCIDFVRRRGAAGVMYTPVAILLASGNGWTMPRSLYAPEVYRTWGQIPYRECDHQLHALFTMLYPGYEDSGFFLNERGFLTPTPYGETADVLMSDARPETLGQYNAIVLAGWQTLDSEQTDKLRAFAEKGGIVVAFAGHLEGCESAQTLFGVKALGAFSRHEDEKIAMGERAVREDAFDAYDAAILSEDAVPLATLQSGAPFMTVRAVKEGKAILVLSPYGMSAMHSSAPMHNDENKSIPLVCDLLRSVKALLGDVFTQQQLARVSNPELETIVNIRDSETLTVTVVNNSFTAQHYRLELVGCVETGRTKIEIPDLDEKTPGYYPPCERPRPPFVPREEGEETLGPGQMAMWEITHAAQGLTYAPEIPMEDHCSNLWVSLRPNGTLIDALLSMPMLDKYFAGIKLDADYVNDMSEEQAQQSGDWLRRRGMKVAVDFAPLLDHYPHMSLVRNMPWKLEKNLQWMERIMDKAALLGADRIILTTHRPAENHMTLDETIADMKKTIGEMREMAARRGLDTILENGVPRAVAADPEALPALFADMKLAVNVGHCLLSGKVPGEQTLRGASGLLISVPLRDEFGQTCNAHLPIRSGGFESQLREILSRADLSGYDFVCLDGIYDSFEEMYLERRTFLSR